MKRFAQMIILIGCIFIAMPGIKAEVVSEIAIGGGYQSNLFNDSSMTGDRFAAFGANVEYYPSASARFSAAARYNAFATYTDLSNLGGEASFTLIPTPLASAFTLALAGNLSVRKFGTTFDLYDHFGSTVGADMGFRPAQWAYLQSSVAYNDNTYMNSDFGSNRNLALSSGVTTTVLGTNTISLKAQYSIQSFDSPELVRESPGHMAISNRESAETFSVSGFTARFSRPLGQRTGIHFSVGHRILHMDDDLAIPGYTIDYLSPWADLWEGTSISGGVKLFFPGQVMTQLSCSYYDKTFVEAVELDDTTGDTYIRNSRSDRLTAISLMISRPVSFSQGQHLTPSASLGMRKNQSSLAYYDYTDLSVSLALTMSL